MLSRPHDWVDVEDFVGPLRLGMTTDGKGRGLFATAPIRRGETVFVEKCFAYGKIRDAMRHVRVYQHEIQRAYPGNDEGWFVFSFSPRK